MKEKDKEQHEEIEKLQRHLGEMEKKINEVQNNWKRALADYKNLEKRTNEEKEQLICYVKRQTIESFLPLFDNLEKIEEHIKDRGLELTLKDFKNTLKIMGVEEIESMGKVFDHNLMEAVETAKGEKNKILKVTCKGYLLNGKLLRPAKVVVGRE